MDVLATGAIAAPLTTAGAALIVSVIVQQTKAMLDRIVAPTSPMQNAVVRLYVALVSAIVVFGDLWLTTGITTRADVLSAISTTGAVVGIAVTGWHALQDSTANPASK